MSDKITFFNILNLFDVVKMEWFFEGCKDRTANGHNMKVSKRHIRKDIEKYLFCVVVDDLNKLSNEILNADNIEKIVKLFDNR